MKNKYLLIMCLSYVGSVYQKFDLNIRNTFKNILIYDVLRVGSSL